MLITTSFVLFCCSVLPKGGLSDVMARVSTFRSRQSLHQLISSDVSQYISIFPQCGFIQTSLDRFQPSIMTLRTREVVFTWLADGTTFTPPPFFFVFHSAESAACPTHVIWDFVCTCFVGIAGIARQTNRRQARRILLWSCCLSTYPAVKYEYVRVTEHQWK